MSHLFFHPCLVLFMINRIISSYIVRMPHSKSRCPIYPRSDGTVMRYPVPDDKVPWNVEFDYTPTNFTSASVLGKSWADLEVGNPRFSPQWNSVDGLVNRKSFMGNYSILDGYPLNPMGRTGLVGRGVLGRWGPNHAADPIVTVWKRGTDGSIIMDMELKKPILQFLAIKRRDNGEWAIPGGMVDPGEVVSSALKREFFEESLNALEKTDTERKILEEQYEKFFSSGVEIYKGYVDDPRNTDNAWMETVAYNFHDETGGIVGSMPLKAGDDAVGVKLVEISSSLKLYASHLDFIKIVSERLNAFW